MNKFIINEEEKRRILMMHESATKRQYLNEEQDAIEVRDLTKDDIQSVWFSDGGGPTSEGWEENCEIINNNTILFKYDENVNFFEGDRIRLEVNLHNFILLNVSEVYKETKNTQKLEYFVMADQEEENNMHKAYCNFQIVFKIPEQSIYNNVFARDYNYPFIEVPCMNAQDGKLKVMIGLPEDATVLTTP